jgi:hypothetical protein
LDENKCNETTESDQKCDGFEKKKLASCLVGAKFPESAETWETLNSLQIGSKAAQQIAKSILVV